MTDTSTWKLTVVREPAPPLEYGGIDTSKPFAGAADVWARFRTYCERLDREEFLVVPLDTKHKPLGFHVVSIGSVSASIVHPREVAKVLLLTSATAWLCVHNHPSGIPEPSKEDVEITRRLKDVGELLGIRLLDHIIIGTDRYVSFSEDGYF
jgi:DNA repair protein RadC